MCLENPSIKGLIYFSLFSRLQMGPMLLSWGNLGTSRLHLPSLEEIVPYKALTMRAMTTSGQ